MTAWTPRIGPLLRVAATSCRVRYRLDRPYGPLFLAAAVIDPFVYSGIVYFVVSTIFGRVGPERFHLTLLGFIAFRWTLSCLLRAHDLDFLRRRMTEHTSDGLPCALAAIMAPATLAFLLSLTLAFAPSLIWQPPGRSLAALGFLPLVIIAQALWSAVLVLAVAIIEARSIAVRDAFLITLTAMIWFISPVMFQFVDVPLHAAAILWINPASYIVSAFHNTYWFGRIPSFLTLGIATASAAAILYVTHKRERRRVALGQARRPAVSKDHVPLLIVRTGAAPFLDVVSDPASTERAARFTRWEGRMADIPGNGLVALLLAARDDREPRSHIAAIGKNSAIGALYSESIALYPDAALDQLALSLALECSPGPIVLDRVLDNAATDFVWKAWGLLEARAEADAGTTVITERYLPLPTAARGMFRIVGSSGTVAEGRLGPQLAAQFERLSAQPAALHDAAAQS